MFRKNDLNKKLIEHKQREANDSSLTKPLYKSHLALKEKEQNSLTLMRFSNKKTGSYGSLQPYYSFDIIHTDSEFEDYQPAAKACCIL